MSAGTVGIPLTGSGGTTADVAVDLVSGAAYQYMKLASGTIGSTVVAAVLSSAPSAAEGGLVVRPLLAPSTEQIGNVGQAQSTPGSSDNYWWVRTVGSAAGSTVVDAQASSAGSTKLFGRVDVNNPTTSVTITNPTTAVTVSNPTTSVTLTNPTTSVDLSSAGSTRVVGTVNVTSGVVLGAGSSANTLGAIAQGAGSTSVAPWYVISTAAAGAGSTVVDAQASSVGSTKLFGQVTVANPTTAVTVSSGVVLGAGSSANTIGAIAQGAGSTSVAPWYVISTAAAGAGSTTVDANLSSAGSTRVVGTVNVSSGVVLGAGSSANTLGAVAQGAGSTTIAPWYVISTASAGAGSTVVDLGAGTTANYQFMQSIPFSTGNVARSSVSTTVDTQVIAGNASRKALVIANGSTTQTVGLGLTTAAVTTARANINMYLPPTTQVRFASNGDFPLYLGPVRGINLTSTTVAGYVIVTEFS